LLAFRAGQQMKLSPEEIRSLNRALDRLPEFIDAAPLEEDERAVMKKVFPQAGSTTVEDSSRIVSQEFKIRGVFRAPSEEEERTGASVSRLHSDALVLLPSRTAADFFFDRLDDGGYGLSQATVVVDNEQNLAQVSERLRNLGYSEYSLIQLVERIRKYVRIVTWVFAGVACVALFVAAVGITNTMIMSVVERTHEIGVMKSVGARDSHILSVFVLEGALLGFVGSVAAIALSWCLSFGIDWIIRWILEQEIQRSFERQTALLFPWWVIAAVIAMCSLVTILAAIVPARRAARISPIAALRHD
jgi:putative ABC transport system permease protein